MSTTQRTENDRVGSLLKGFAVGLAIEVAALSAFGIVLYFVWKP